MKYDISFIEHHSLQDYGIKRLNIFKHIFIQKYIDL